LIARQEGGTLSAPDLIILRYALFSPIVWEPILHLVCTLIDLGALFMVVFILLVSLDVLIFLSVLMTVYYLRFTLTMSL
jgi:hypothetical protein